MLAVARIVGVALALLVLGSPALRAQTAPSPAPATTREISVGEDRFQKGTPIPSWVDRANDIPATKLSAPAVILLADTQFLVADRPAHHVHRASVANTPASLQNVARMSIEFNPTYQSVELHSLRLRRDGQVLERLSTSKITFLQRETGYDMGVYTGNVTASVIIPDLRVGDALEYEYTVTGANPVLGNKYVQEASWDHFDATQLRRVTLWVPPGRDIHWKMEGGAPIEPSDERIGALRRLRWEGRELPRREIEPGTPVADLPIRYLQFSEFKDWNDVAKWAEGLFASAAGDSPELRELVAKFSQLPTPGERVSAALAWVQGQVRYVSLSFGESTHRPSPAAVTLERRYGDCKDKSALLVQILRGMGIVADPVLVSAFRVRGLEKNLPSPHSFDHAIVRVDVDGRFYFLDPTRSGQSGRLARMGQPWDAADVLVVNANTKWISKVAPELSTKTGTRVEEHLKITAWDKPATMEVTMIWGGFAAEAARVNFAEATDDRVTRYLLKDYERRYPGYRLSEPVKLEDDKDGNLMVARFRLAVPSAVVSLPDRWSVRYEANNVESALPMPEAATRKSPFELPYPLAMRYTFEVEFPTSVSATVDPGKQEFLQPGLLMKHWTSFRGNRATMALDLAVLKPSIPPEDVRKYMEAVLWLRRVSRDGFWAAKATTPASTAAAATSATFRERQEQFVKARIERMNKTLQDGKLQGDDLANAYCTRAMANASLRSFDQAAQDVDRAVQASPDAPFIQYCRGATLARSGRIKDAIAAYGQAIVLDPSYAPAYAARGVARVNASQFEAALADFAGFERADPARKRYAQLWTAFAMRRLGKEPDAAGKADAKSAASDAWPAPALAMMYDLLTPDEVLTKANALKGDERELMLVEAYHAIAQWHLARGEKAEAAAYFRKTADIGALNYYEHDSSLRELKALGQSQ